MISFMIMRLVFMSKGSKMQLLIYLTSTEATLNSSEFYNNVVDERCSSNSTLPSNSA